MPKVAVQTESGVEASISVYEGVSKKTGNAYEAISIKVGEWSTLIFAKSKFEMEYIKKQLGYE